MSGLEYFVQIKAVFTYLLLSDLVKFEFRRGSVKKAFFKIRCYVAYGIYRCQSILWMIIIGCSLMGSLTVLILLSVVLSLRERFLFCNFPLFIKFLRDLIIFDRDREGYSIINIHLHLCQHEAIVLSLILHCSSFLLDSAHFRVFSFFTKLKLVKHVHINIVICQYSQASYFVQQLILNFASVQLKNRKELL